MASWPNIAFDLCGICCGHFLMPFKVFFSATLIGKAIIRNTYQTVIYVTLCSEEYMDVIIRILQNLAPDWMHIDQLIREAVQQTQLAFRRGTVGTQAPSTLGYIWNFIMFALISLFLCSCISQFAQYTQLTQDNEASDKMRERLPAKIKAALLSPTSGKVRLGRGRLFMTQDDTRTECIERLIVEKELNANMSCENISMQGKWDDSEIDRQIIEITSGHLNIQDFMGPDGNKCMIPGMCSCLL